MIKKISLFLIFALLITAMPMAAFADEQCKSGCLKGCCFKASPWTTEEGYGNKVLQKFYFGAKNTLAGWTQLISQPEAAIKEKTCVVAGIGKGIVHAVVDTVGGVLHLVTFPIPQIDVPLPHGGVQL